MAIKKTRLFTIGFTKKSAEQFFSVLKDAGVRRILDVRLNNVSQLAGFAKRDDLRFFLKAICGIEYLHLPQCAPTKEMLDAYRKNGGNWTIYEKDFLKLLAQRRIEEHVAMDLFHQGCLLCSEENPEHCHRRLVADYLTRHWGNVEIIHLV